MHRTVATVGVALSFRAPAADPFAFVRAPLAPTLLWPRSRVRRASSALRMHACVPCARLRVEDVKRVSDRMYMGDKLLGIAWPCGITLVYEFYARETSIYTASRETSKR